ncbi:MAG: hypothetical protein NZZ41_04800 [Candidatus Dojkabacteria bacterium]|nr:hypothetical protein [Candidatus Dojkabacteria bacterium]
MIYLAIITHETESKYDEYHIIYEGHSTLESARNEIDEIRRRLIKHGKKPFDCYIYESKDGKPLYGYPPYRLDQIDFNFYKEPTEQEKIKAQEIEQQLLNVINKYV